MAKKKENFNGMKEVELKKELVVMRESLRALRFKMDGSKSKNVKESANLKKQVARALTALNTKK